MQRICKLNKSSSKRKVLRDIKNKMVNKKDKRGVAIEGLVWWVIAIAVLVIMVVLAVILREKLGDMGSYIKNLFRFGGK